MPVRSATGPSLKATPWEAGVVYREMLPKVAAFVESLDAPPHLQETLHFQAREGLYGMLHFGAVPLSGPAGVDYMTRSFDHLMIPPSEQEEPAPTLRNEMDRARELVAVQRISRFLLGNLGALRKAGYAPSFDLDEAVAVGQEEHNERMKGVKVSLTIGYLDLLESINANLVDAFALSDDAKGTMRAQIDRAMMSCLTYRAAWLPEDLPPVDMVSLSLRIAVATGDIISIDDLFDTAVQVLVWSVHAPSVLAGHLEGPCRDEILRDFPGIQDYLPLEGPPDFGEVLSRHSGRLHRALHVAPGRDFDVVELLKSCGRQMTLLEWSPAIMGHLYERFKNDDEVTIWIGDVLNKKVQRGAAGRFDELYFFFPPLIAPETLLTGLKSYLAPGGRVFIEQDELNRPRAAEWLGRIRHLGWNVLEQSYGPPPIRTRGSRMHAAVQFAVLEPPG